MFQSIKQKGRALELYGNLLIQSPDVFSTSMLSNAQSVEQRMMERLTEQYQLLFGAPPGYTVEPMDVAFPTFTDGVVLAINYNF